MNGLLHLSTKLLAQVMASSSSTGSASDGGMGYRPFITPLPIWDYWYLLLLPLCLGVSIVYKSIKCTRMSEVPKQAILITAWILGGMIAAAVALAVIVKVF